MVLYACMCCVCVFSLHRESPDMILGDKPLILEVVLSHLLRGSPDYKSSNPQSIWGIEIISLDHNIIQRDWA
jgi:hypothetical protein